MDMPYEALVRILRFTDVCQISNVCAVALSFKVACQEPMLWEHYCCLRWRCTEATSLRTAMRICGAYRFFRSRIMAEASSSSISMTSEWLVTLDVWVRDAHCHSSVHEAASCYGEYQHCASDVSKSLVSGFNFDLSVQPVACQIDDGENHPWEFWEIAVSVIRKRDGAVAPLVRRSYPWSTFFGPPSTSTTTVPDDFIHLEPFLPCQMCVKNDISNRTADQVMHVEIDGIIGTFQTTFHIGKYNDFSHGIRLLRGDKFELVTLLLSLDQVPVYHFSSGEPDEYLRLLDAYLRFQS